MPDLYTEVFEIIDSCTFAAKSISLTMWEAFELMHATFKAGAELYLEGKPSCDDVPEIYLFILIKDMLPALENFIQFGPDHMAQNPRYIEMVADLIRDIFNDGKISGVDRICGCKLSEALMLSVRGHVDDHIGEFIKCAMNNLLNDEVKVKSYRIHLIEMVINAIHYNPMLAMSILEMNGQTNKFFGMWFANIDNMVRVHDKKLSISAITALLTMPAQNVPQSVHDGWPRLLHGLVKLFQTLPQAEKSEYRKPVPFTGMMLINPTQIGKQRRMKAISS